MSCAVEVVILFQESQGRKEICGSPMSRLVSRTFVAGLEVGSGELPTVGCEKSVFLR